MNLKKKFPNFFYKPWRKTQQQQKKERNWSLKPKRTKPPFSCYWKRFEIKWWRNSWNKIVQKIISFVLMYCWPAWQYSTKFMVFSFLPKNVNFMSKNAISCLFLKNVSPSKRVICFIRNNLHFPMVEGIAFYALHKSRVLIIPCKADGFCLFIGLPDEI